MARAADRAPAQLTSLRSEREVSERQLVGSIGRRDECARARRSRSRVVTRTQAEHDDAWMFAGWGSNSTVEYYDADAAAADAAADADGACAH